jgi:cold shock protein
LRSQREDVKLAREEITLGALQHQVSRRTQLPGKILFLALSLSISEKLMALGTIKKLMTDKHCGFITPAIGGCDVFFHGSVVAGDEFKLLIAGQRVEFELDSAPDDRGLRAGRVRPIRPSEVVNTAPPTEFRMLRRHHASRAKKPTWRN